MENKYSYWLENIKDTKLSKKLNELSEEKIKDNFSSSLSFGTGGIREIMELGSNKINELTVSKLASAVGKYLVDKNAKVVIGFDTRKHSKRFSRLFAKVLRRYNVEVLLFKNFCPTPVLVYATTYYESDLSIMITASHNRKEYNGIKIYGSDGIQINKEIQEKITKLFDATDEVESYNSIYKNKLGKIKYVKDDIIGKFIAGTYENKKRNLKITYTALNGTGFKAVKKLLNYNGFKLNAVQTKPDPDFSTCPYPNPEFEEAFCEAKKVAKKFDNDIIIATDPDADRLGVMVKHNNEFVKLSGNEVGYIFADYLLSNTEDKIVITSVVTSPLIDVICKKNKAKLYKTLTGFMSMGNKAKELANKYGRENIVLIYEESCGYSVNNSFDKDGISASLLISIIAEKLKNNDKTLVDYLNYIYVRYGKLTSLSSSIEIENSARIVDKIRKTKLKELNLNITKIIDYQNDDTKLPKQNFLEFKIKDGSFILRPSGTEPKLKIYLFHKDEKFANELLEKLVNYLKSLS